MGQGYVGSSAPPRSARGAHTSQLLTHLRTDHRSLASVPRPRAASPTSHPRRVPVLARAGLGPAGRCGCVSTRQNLTTYDIRSMESWHQICLTARAHSTLHARHHISIPMYHVASAPPASASHLHAPRTAHALLRVPPRAPPRACAPAPRCRPSAANRRRQPPRRITSSSRLPSR